jgi:prepilin-type N-terminal cleavage/methylation domain-containing protein
MHKHYKSVGFTIVELLVVIVIIGIIATVTFVAYSGANERAIAASLQADLTSAAKQLKLDQSFDNTGDFPISLAAANGGNGIEPGPDTDYQYFVDNSVSPKIFCITATKSNQSYMINQKGTPELGGCSGHVVAGVDPITNLVANPSFENTSTCIWANTGVSLTTSSTNPYVGSSSLRANVPSSSPDAYFICEVNVNPGSVYTISYYARADTATSIDAGGGFQENDNGYRMLCEDFDPIDVTTTWKRITYVCPTYDDSPSMARIVFRTSVTDGVPIYYDGAIVTEGYNQTNYADGTFDNWDWNGSANDSTSYGPIYWGDNGNRLTMNYFSNPINDGYSFSDYGYWGNPSGLSYNMHDTTHVLYGTYAAQLSSNVGSGEYYFTTQDPFRPEQGKTYIFSAYVYIPVGSGIDKGIIAMRGWASYSFVSDWTYSNFVEGEWTRIYAKCTATSAEPLWRFSIADMWGSGSNQQFWVDGIMLTEGNTLPDYADGDTEGWSWTGTTGSAMSMGVVD